MSGASNAASSPSVLGGTYSVPPSIIAKSLEHLRQYETEAVCFWLGATGVPHSNIADLWIPNFTASVVSYDINPLEMLRLKQHLDKTATSLLIQVHSHPGSAFHSSIDDNNAASPWPGYISVVVPYRGHIRGDFWDVVEVYELLGGHKWRHIEQNERRRRFLGTSK